MSTIKSSAENLTLNADGSGNDVLIQSNGSTKAIVTAEGSVGIGVTPETILSTYPTVQIGYGGAIAANTTNPSRFSIAANSYINSSGNRAYIQTDEATEMWMNAGTYEFRVAASGTADSDITWTTGFEIRNDGKARAKNGLLFGSDTAAANALDDYEEGTYAAVVSGSTSGTFTMATENTLAYTKIGRLVTVQGYVGIQSGSVGGNVRLSLPFAPTALTEDADYNFPSLMIQNQGNTIAGQKYLFLQVDGSAYFYRVQDSGAANYISNGDVDGNFEIGVSFTYISG